MSDFELQEIFKSKFSKLDTSYIDKNDEDMLFEETNFIFRKICDSMEQELGINSTDYDTSTEWYDFIQEEMINYMLNNIVNAN